VFSPAYVSAQVTAQPIRTFSEEFLQRSSQLATRLYAIRVLPERRAKCPFRASCALTMTIILGTILRRSFHRLETTTYHGKIALRLHHFSAQRAAPSRVEHVTAFTPGGHARELVIKKARQAIARRGWAPDEHSSPLFSFFEHVRSTLSTIS